MRSLAIRGGAAVAALVLIAMLWLSEAPRLSGWIDVVTTAPVANLSPSPFGWNGVWLQFGPPLGEARENFVGSAPEILPQFRALDLTGPGPLYGPAARLAHDGEGRLVLSAGGKSFALAAPTGRRAAADLGDGETQEYAAEPGDAASLTISRSWLAWPTPFEMDVVGMGGVATTWRRRVYYRLSWAKPSGARLSMLWAGEQSYDGVNGWRAPGASLIDVDIRGTAPVSGSPR